MSEFPNVFTINEDGLDVLVYFLLEEFKDKKVTISVELEFKGGLDEV